MSGWAEFIDMGRQTDQAILSSLQRIERKLDTLLRAVQEENPNMEKLMAELDNLIQAVERNSSVDQSAVTLLQGLTDKLNALASQGGSIDAARVQELADALQASSDRLADAISANTPAA